MTTCEVEDEQTVEEIRMYVSEVTRSWPVSHDRLEEIREATDKDLVMQEAKKLTVDGWPEQSGDVASDLRDLHSVRSTLSKEESL